MSTVLSTYTVGSSVCEAASIGLIFCDKASPVGLPPLILLVIIMQMAAAATAAAPRADIIIIRFLLLIIDYLPS